MITIATSTITRPHTHTHTHTHKHTHTHTQTEGTDDIMLYLGILSVISLLVRSGLFGSKLKMSCRALVKPEFQSKTIK